MGEVSPSLQPRLHCHAGLRSGISFFSPPQPGLPLPSRLGAKPLKPRSSKMQEESLFHHRKYLLLGDEVQHRECRHLIT